MTHKINKFVFSFLILLFITGIVLYVLSNPNKPKEVPIPISEVNAPVSSIPTSGQYCFARVQKATTDAPYNVEEHVVLNFDGTKITGTKKGTQSGPDMTNGYEGTLKGATIIGGATSADEMELTYSYIVEGSKNRELEDYTMENENLIKNRWVLHEAKINGESILVPDYVGDPTLITYTREDCVNDSTPAN